MSTEIIALIIFAVCIVLFVTNWVNTTVAAALGCLAFCIFGVCDYSVAFSGLSDPLPALIFGSLVVGEGMRQTGVDVIIGKFVMKISRDNERLFILLGGIASGLLSMWMSNTAVVACFLPIIASIAKTSDHMTMKNMTMSVTFGAMFGGACTLVGSTSQLAVNGIMSEMTGEKFEMFTLMPVGLMLFAAFLLFEQLVGYKLGIRIWGNRQNEGIDYESAEEGQHEIEVRKGKIIALVVIFVLMVASYIINKIPSQVTALSAAMACFVTRCAEPKKTLKRLNWNTVFFLACTLGLANGLVQTNLVNMLSDGITKVLGGNVNAYVVLAVVLLLAMVLSNFLANATTCLILTPIVIGICETYGFNVIPFCLGIAFAASTTCATPIAHAQITMTMVAGYRFGDYAKANIPIQVLTFVVLMVALPLIYTL